MGAQCVHPGGPLLVKANVHREKLFHQFLVPEPVAKAFDPIVGGLVVFGHAEAMAASRVGVQLGRLVGGFPGQEKRRPRGGYRIVVGVQEKDGRGILGDLQFGAFSLQV